MPICKPDDLPAALPPAARLLGLDVGGATVGVAVSDPSLTIATARETLRRGRRFRDVATRLLALLDDAGAAGAVVGLPLDPSGRKGPRAQAAEGFVRNLLALRDLPVAFWDERHSTNAVERTMLQADISRAKRAVAIDAAAAAYILQGYLDYLKDHGAPSNFEGA